MIVRKEERVVIYDNGGETLDRYTIFIGDDVFGMSDQGLGFNMYIGDRTEIEEGDHLGIKLDHVPHGIKNAINERLKLN
jgi:hypothetical protein